MNQKKLAVWLKIIVAGIGLCGAVLYAFVIPHLGNNVARDNPEYAFCYWPWLVFLWATALPCYAALVLLWRIAAGTAPFPHKTAKGCASSRCSRRGTALSSFWETSSSFSWT